MLDSREEATGPLVEIDHSKAFPYAFSQITEIPNFNEFDYFQPWDIDSNSDIKPLSLYLVQSSPGNLFLNKRLTLCYVRFLTDFTDIEIVAVIPPSNVWKVN